MITFGTSTKNGKPKWENQKGQKVDSLWTTESNLAQAKKGLRAFQGQLSPPGKPGPSFFQQNNQKRTPTQLPLRDPELKGDHLLAPLLKMENQHGKTKKGQKVDSLWTTESNLAQAKKGLRAFQGQLSLVNQGHRFFFSH